MSKSRLETLKEFLEKNPKDSFSRYALAMEFVSANELDVAIGHFTKIIELDPDYTATYFQLGQVYEATGSIDEAERIYKLGIEACERRGDEHTKNELQEMLDQLRGSVF